jgi:co-chaperonin GroES (HSP10)
MKLKFLLLVFIIQVSLCFSQADRTKTFTQVVNLNPGDKNGFIGTVTMVYAFGNCYGDAIMAFGYKDLKLTKVKYNNKTYTANSLDIPNFDKYKMSLTKVDAAFRFNYAPVTTKTLSYVLDKYDLGCFGETVTIASKNTEYTKNLDKFSVTFENAEYGMNMLLSSKIEAFEKKKLNTKKYNSLMFTAGNTADLYDKLQILKKALQIVPNAREKTITKISIKNLKEKIATKEKEAKEKIKKENQSSAKGIVLTSTSTKKNTSKVSAVTSSSKAKTSYNYTPPTSYNVSKTMARNNTFYQQSFSQIDKAADQLSSLFSSMIDRKQKQREARARAIALKNQRIEDEKKRKQYFYNQADRYIKEMQDIVNKRKAFFIEKQNNPTYNLNGASFEPIYIIYAYTKKGYDRYYDYARYPDMKIKLNMEQATVYFSPVMAVFPFSDGSYPYYEDIKRNIVNNHITIDQSNYDITFLNAETSVDKIINSLTKTMNTVVYKHEFSSAVPSKNNNIIFLNDKIVDSNHVDYWTGKAIKRKETKKIDYFKTKKTTKKSKIDYFKTKDSIPKKKIDYWGSGSKKTDSTKIKNSSLY